MTAMPPPAAQAPPRRWSPTWAKVLTWISFVPAAYLLYLGVAIFLEAFEPGPLPGIRFIVGPTLALAAILLALPSVLFLARSRKVAFILAMCLNGLLLLGMLASALLLI